MKIKLVSRAHKKDFKFPKQHWVARVEEEIQMKGAMTHCSAHPGELFFQEVRQAYEQTNKQNEDVQVSCFLILCAQFLRWGKSMRIKKLLQGSIWPLKHKIN